MRNCCSRVADGSIVLAFGFFTSRLSEIGSSKLGTCMTGTAVVDGRDVSAKFAVDS